MAAGEDPTGEVEKTDERTRRILDAAVQLAEAGGFAAVRLRDVAHSSGVALGTVYKRFRGKEDLLMGVLSQEMHDLQAQLMARPVCGPTPLARVTGFFAVMTEFLCRRPNLARAVVRSAAAGEKGLSERLASFNAQLFALSFAALQAGPGREPGPGETVILLALQQVWFSALCGWAGEVHAPAAVDRQVAAAATLMMYGVDRMPAVGEAAGGPLRVLTTADARSRAVDEEVTWVSADGSQALALLLGSPEIDALEVEAGEALTIAAQSTWTGTGRPKLVVLLRAAPAVMAALTRHVDVVLGATEGLSPGAARSFADALYRGLRGGLAVQEAYDAAGAEQFTLATRVGADLRALSMR